MDKRIDPETATAAAFMTAFQRLDETRFAGHVLWRDAPHMHFIVEMLIDGEPVGLTRADIHSGQLKAMGYPEDHGFVFTAKKQQLTGQHQIEARVANLALPVGAPIDLKTQPVANASGTGDGRVEWLGGLRLAGTVAVGTSELDCARINVHENGAPVAQANARRWTSTAKTRDDLTSARFDFHLPSVLADGRPHRLTVTNDMGQELPGSPVQILAFADPLKSLVERESHLAAEGMRAEWFDRFLPMSMPFENFDDWKRRFARPLLILKHEPPVRVVLMGGGNVDDALNRLSSQKYNNWSATVLQLQSDSRFEWPRLKEAVTAETDENTIAIFLRPSAILRDDAFAQLAAALTEHDGARAAYGDIELASHGGTTRPLFFGAFDYERMLEQGYAAILFALRASEMKIPKDEKSGNLARVLLALCDANRANDDPSVIHVPGLLATFSREHLPSPAEVEAATSAHLRARKVKAQVRAANGSALAAVHVRRTAPDAAVSIVIPTRDRVDLLAPCIDSILTKTTKRKLDIVIVDNGSAAPDTLAFLKAHQRKGHRVVDAPGPFNHSHLNNVGVAAAKSEIICLLNNDTEVIDPHWLDELLSRLSDPGVGAVAPKLLWPNRMVQHGGIVLGPNFAASDAFNDCLDVDPGYCDMLRVAHEATALSAACMVVRRQDYITLRGFDEIAFPVLFNDVDFCLRLRALGKRNIFTPHTALIHHESATRQRDIHYSQKSRFQRELALLRLRWADALANDPLYSPFLNLDPYPYSALAWPPRPADPRVNSIAAPNDTASNTPRSTRGGNPSTI